MVPEEGLQVTPLSPHPPTITLATSVCLSIPFRNILSVCYYATVYHHTTCNRGVSMKFCQTLLRSDPPYPNYSWYPAQNLWERFFGFTKM